MKTIVVMAIGLSLFLTACGGESGAESIDVTPLKNSTTTLPTATTQATTTTEGITTTQPTTTTGATTTTFRFTPPTFPTTTTEKVFREAGCGIEDTSSILYENEISCSTKAYHYLKNYIFNLEGNLRLITSFPLTNTTDCKITNALYEQFLVNIKVIEDFFMDGNIGRLAGEVEYREEDGNCNLYAKNLLIFFKIPAEGINTNLQLWNLINTEDPDNNNVFFNCGEDQPGDQPKESQFCHYYVFPLGAER